MSIMLVEKETFENVAKTLKIYEDEKEIISFVREWFELNRLSYSIRYNERVESILPNFNKEAKQLSDIQLLKSLKCIRYNIDFEGDKNNWSVIKLEKIINYLNDIITKKFKVLTIEELPEYWAAKWG